jgi:hypothetical protein
MMERDGSQAVRLTEMLAKMEPGLRADELALQRQWIGDSSTKRAGRRG